MPDIYMDVDTALAEVPVNIMPLLDDTDFKTRETTVAYNAAGMDLVWNFVTTGGGFTQTAVTPTTAGTYDWTHQGDGMYTIEIPASGGASINNDTEGYGWFTGLATGVLPWRGPIIGFRASGLNDALIDSAWSATRGLAGTALPNAAADAAGGLPISDAGGLDLDAKIGALTFTVAGKVDANTTHWSGTANATPDTAGYPKITIKSGTGAGELSLSAGRVLLQGGLRKNVAKNKFTFLMTDSTNHNPAAGLTVSGTVRLDGGSATALADSVTGLANGLYEVDLAAGETNGDVVTLRFTATGADDLVITLLTDA
jgi:hypothetical protein